jgi:hypothetical protein
MSKPMIDEVRQLRQQAEDKRLEAIKDLLSQRDEIDRQLAELDFRDVSTPPPADQEPATPGKRVRSDQTKLRMAAQYWIRAGEDNPDGMEAACDERPGLEEMIKQMKAEGSNGYSPRNKNMRPKARKQTP